MYINLKQGFSEFRTSFSFLHILDDNSVSVPGCSLQDSAQDKI
jgi:hypothetical protein